MRRPSRTIVALAAPVLTVLALGCAKRSAPSADHPRYVSHAAVSLEDEDYAYGGADYDDEDADVPDVAEVEEVEMASSADRVSMAPMAASPPSPERSSRRSRRRSRREKRAKKSAASPVMAGAVAVTPATQPTGRAVSSLPTPTPTPERDTEGYNHIQENDFVAVADDPRSTFSIDVDTASYSNSRRFIREGRVPPPAAVRIEELINYFDYAYPQPKGDDPFSVTTEVGACPWNADHRLVHVGLQGKDVAVKDVPARNLVFLLDVSGSMSSADKLPLLKQGLRMLLTQLRPEDRISMVVYAGASGVVLNPTSKKAEVLAALDRLQAGGSTNGGAGIELAYRLAERNFVKGGINRVLLATDGDFNVGVTNQGGLIELIEAKRKSGVFLSVLGFGRGNLKDSTMEQIADKGNGNYAYIDSVSEARKVLVEQAGATLMTIAKDVKIQVEFNPANVAAYRLIGYENRKLAHRDFNDDTKDAGEIGAGHTVTALYEVVPVGRGTAPQVDPLQYQDDTGLSAAANNGDLMTVKLRYKQPNGSRSRLLSVAVRDGDGSLVDRSPDFRFSAAVAEMGMLLRHSKWRHQASWDQVYSLARSAQDHDTHGRRAEFLDLVIQAAALSGVTVDASDKALKVAR